MLSVAMLHLRHDELLISLQDEPAYSAGSADNPRTYDREVRLGDERSWRFSTQYAVRVEQQGGSTASAILLAGGGATRVHESSAVIVNNALHIACGPFLVALTLPTLHVDWSCQVDDATCFGVHSFAAGLISHGELQIARVALDGSVLWRASGRDILTGTLEVTALDVRVTD